MPWRARSRHEHAVREEMEVWREEAAAASDRAAGAELETVAAGHRLRAAAREWAAARDALTETNQDVRPRP